MFFVFYCIYNSSKFGIFVPFSSSVKKTFFKVNFFFSIPKEKKKKKNRERERESGTNVSFVSFSGLAWV